jgi:chemotaxis response regulator CheB
MRPAAAENFRVVCLGGSAGGLQGYIDILRGLSCRYRHGVCNSPHRALKDAHLLPLILANATEMPVAQVEEGMRLEPNRVFIMPPHIDMTIMGNVFHLRATPGPSGWPRTISVFLFSLAEAIGPRAVAVILSGMDHDGSAALQAIKVAGGITFAQSNAVYDSMPRHAMQTGYVDFCMRPAGQKDE